MVRLLAFAPLALAACDTSPYTKPIALPPHGAAVRANMAAQIIDPTPPPSTRPEITDAARPARAKQAYRVGEVEEPSREDAAASTAQVK